MQVRLYQINPDRDQNRVMHEPLDNLLKCQGCSQVDESLYDRVLRADVDCENLEQLYSNVFFPITNAAKCAIQDAVLKAYSQHMDQQYADQQNSQWEKLDDGFLPFAM